MHDHVYHKHEDGGVKLKPLRTIDLARAAGVSAQTVRSYEAWGVIPPAERSVTGYRLYGPRHLQAITTTRLLRVGYGAERAYASMRAVHRGHVDAALVAVDACHADLHRRRAELEATLHALRDAATLPSLQRIDAKRPRWRRALYVGEAARHVGAPVSTVRFWEEQGLLRPRRDPESHYRLYDAEHVRALQVIALLREGGYDIAAIRVVTAELAAGTVDAAVAAAARRRSHLMTLTRQATAATAALWSYVQYVLDNDVGGAKLWQQVKEAYPRAEAIVRERPPAGAKDWNNALRAAPGRAEGPGQEDDRAPSRSRGRAPGRDEPSRG